MTEERNTPESEFDLMRKLAPAYDLLALQQRVRDLEAAIDEHRAIVDNVPPGGTRCENAHTKLWELGGAGEKSTP